MVFLLCIILFRVVNFLYYVSYVLSILLYIFGILIILDMVCLIVTTVLIRPFRKTYFKRLISFILIILIISTCLVFHYKGTHYVPTENTNVQDNTIYATYHDECNTCIASHDSLLEAIKLYNATHTSKVYLINLNSDQPEIQKLTNKLDRYGSVVKMTDKKMFTTSYTLKTLNGEPFSNSASSIYNLLVEMNAQ